jgi:hypothetical protein
MRRWPPLEPVDPAVLASPLEPLTHRPFTDAQARLRRSSRQSARFGAPIPGSLPPI